MDDKYDDCDYDDYENDDHQHYLQFKLATNSQAVRGAEASLVNLPHILLQCTMQYFCLYFVNSYFVFCKYALHTFLTQCSIFNKCRI